MNEDSAARLRRKLSALEQQIRNNEQIWAGFRQIEFDMIGGQTLSQVLGSLINGLLKEFPSVDFVTVAHIDPQYELNRLLIDENGNEFRGYVPLEEDFLNSVFGSSPLPILGRFEKKVSSRLFPKKHPDMIGSMALAPLILHGKIIGCLNQASRNPEHFRDGTATDLLQHLAAVTAMCIDNAVSHEKLKQDGLTDPLTGIYNRRFFERRLGEELEKLKRSRNDLACIVADIDHFKRINDMYGHLVGDHVLQRVATELGKDLRSSDVLARYGGEEFVLLLPATQVELALEIAERMRRSLEVMSFRDLGYSELRVSATLGLSIAKGLVGDGSEDLFHRADKALYDGKQSGRNRVVVAA